MKKFSNLNEVEQIEKVSSLEKNIKKILKETLNVTLTNEKYVGQTIKIEGQDEFATEIFNLIKESCNIQYDHLTTERLMHDQVLLNSNLNRLYELYKKMNATTPPDEIFNSEDYVFENEIYTIKKLDKMPVDFLDFVNKEDSDKYFEHKNSINIKFENNKWRVSFVPNLNEYNNDYLDFVKSNKNFMADFIKSAEKLVLLENLIIDQKLIQCTK